MASISTIRPGDMLEVDIGGRLFYALAKSRAYEEELIRWVDFDARAICPTTGNGYTRARAREIRTVFRPLGRRRRG